jgi:hypothetical protein
MGMAVGSLEAALRERGMLRPVANQEHMPSAPGLVHRPSDDRVPSCEQVVTTTDRMTLWGRCGYVPESRIKEVSR